MQKPAPLPLPTIATTVHGASRAAFTRLVSNAMGHCETFESLEEQLEYFTLVRDYAAASVAACEALRTKVRAALASQQHGKRAGTAAA